MISAMFSSRGSIFGGGFGTLDKAFLLWAIFPSICFSFLFSFQSGAVVNQGSFLLDVFGAFFFLRFLIHDEDDILSVAKVFAVIVAIVGVCMLNEKFQNLFGYLGGSPPSLPQVRDGAIRAQGPFSHPILAGSFGATLVPLFLWLWQSGEIKTLAVMVVPRINVYSAGLRVEYHCMAYVAGIAAVCFWPMRKRVRAFRWGVVIALVSVHLVMKAPVWFLIARVDLTGASSGYHHAGTRRPVHQTHGPVVAHGSRWQRRLGIRYVELSNQFVAEGVGGGLATFICFIASDLYLFQ